LFRNFIAADKFPWTKRLTDACKTLSVDAVEGQAFLGCGARGRVFKVEREDGTYFALKIVDQSSAATLYREATASNEPSSTGFTITPAGQCVDTGEGAALLLFPVGEPLPQPKTREEVKSL